MAKRSRKDSPPEPSELAPTFAIESEPLALASHLPQRKHVHLDASVQSPELIRCAFPPHRKPVSFSTYEEYEIHYKQSHVNRCSECGKNFPSELFLARHIEENHDPLTAARRERGEKTFGCFVEGCERRCSTPQKRRMHLIDKHSFPRTYNFYIINDGIDKHKSLLKSSLPQHRRVSIPASTQHEPPQRRLQPFEFMKTSTQATPAPAEPPYVQMPNSKTPNPVTSNHTSPRDQSETVHICTSGHDVTELTNSMSALKFIPTSVLLRQDREKSSASSTTT
ncbi:hypothetical protein D8B26_005810 [Coccidioides posadasii str. Silveira]|uniref:Uncharacterized protein n=2 Tax=Coccidioides posadasii TaxID=199306 RepID=E9DB00_COCPS|nr:conserved hypothetical protein [Coccidioides posadasii str. Silveira]KMM67014.1 hypothetical protein CPAG_03350 [Coccidioides posadasii RMSCC 3488]QVM11159.1 hypothetical protein D8B26_005810 [Coccidioides posadasii str. Silveira]